MNNVEGMNELLAKLSTLGGNIKEASRKGLERCAKKIQANSKLLAPVKTGHLRNSIKTKSDINGDIVKAQVYTNLEYGPYVEFGTGQRGAKSNINRPDGISYKADWKGMPAQPYMTPAYLYARNNKIVEQELVKTIQREIKKVESGKK